MTLDSKPSTPDPPNTGKVNYRDDETETPKNFWKTTTKPGLTTIIPTFT